MGEGAGILKKQCSVLGGDGCYTATTMTDDAELLRRYAATRDEEAFAELVRRHLSLVYHAALRFCGGDRHRAEDVAQAVFTDLAQKAEKLTRHSVLAGWLYTSTRYAAVRAIRTEVRRQTREQEAHAMNEALAGGEAEWESIRPVLDEALLAINERDREAVLLRFFEGRTFAEIGGLLAVSEDAARVRVDRALDKMRGALARRRVNSSAAALGLVLTSQAGAVVPAGLAATITGAALASTGSGTAVAAISIMSIKTIKVSLVAALVLGGAGGLAWQQRETTRLRAENDGLRRVAVEQERVRAENGRMVQARDAEAMSLRAEIAGLKNQVRQAAGKTTVSAAGSGGGAGATPVIALARGLKPAESFTNAGRQTAAAALETMQWATNGGNVAVMAEGISLPPETRKKAEALFARLPEDKRVQYGTADEFIATLMAGTTQVAGMQVMNEKPGAVAMGFDPALASDPSYRTLHMQTQYVDGRVREGDVVFQQTSTGWHTVVPAWLVDKAAEMLKPIPANLKHDGGH